MSQPLRERVGACPTRSYRFTEEVIQQLADLVEWSEDKDSRPNPSSILRRLVSEEHARKLALRERRKKS